MNRFINRYGLFPTYYRIDPKEKMVKQNEPGNRKTAWLILHFIPASNEPSVHAHLATAARVKSPAALQRCKFDAPLLAAGSFT